MDNHVLKHQFKGPILWVETVVMETLSRLAAVLMVMLYDGIVNSYICLRTPVGVGQIAQLVRYLFCKHNE